MPGFIDTHLHIESSLVTPLEFDRCVLPHGVTTVICDPHEIANVLGAEGIRYFLDCAERDGHGHPRQSVVLRAGDAASRPPARGSRSRTSLPFRDHPKVIGLAEMMNFPGVLAADPGMIAKLAAFQGGHIDGHAPLLSGLALNGYLAAGIRTDHEATTAAEAREKLAKGMAILIREGSVCKDLERPRRSARREHLELRRALHRRPQSARHRRGRPSRQLSIRRLIAKGRPLHHVYRAACHSAARIFGLQRPRPRRAGLARRHRAARRSGEPAASATSSPPAGW